MSHREDCPSEYEARRRGERDYENYGYRRYATPYDGECDEAARAYGRGMASAEYRAEEEAAERASQRRQTEYRQDEYETQCRAEQEQQYRLECEAELAKRYQREMAAAYAELEKNGELNP